MKNLIKLISWWCRLMMILMLLGVCLCLFRGLSWRKLEKEEKAKYKTFACFHFFLRKRRRQTCCLQTLRHAVVAVLFFFLTRNWLFIRNFQFLACTFFYKRYNFFSFFSATVWRWYLQGSLRITRRKLDGLNNDQYQKQGLMSTSKVQKIYIHTKIISPEHIVWNNRRRPIKISLTPLFTRETEMYVCMCVKCCCGLR